MRYQTEAHTFTTKMFAIAVAKLQLLVIVSDPTSAPNEISPVHAGLLPQAQQSVASLDPYCVVPKLYGDYSACCGSEVYDLRFNICCNGATYDSNEYVCCYPSMTPKYKTYGAYTGCCGSHENVTVYDSRNASCCSNSVVYHPQTEVCCFNGTVVEDVGPNAPYSSCCGSSVYDYRTELCCDGVVLPNVGLQQECCGNRSINMTTQRCCIQYVEIPPPTSVNSTGGVAQPPEHVNFQVFSYTIYDLETQLCCGGTVMPSRYGRWSECCGWEVYNYSASVCCYGKVVAQTFGWYSECCGYDVVDSSTTNCCGNETNAMPYDYRTQTCCQGMIENKTFGWESRCCGTTVYNTTRNTCCSGVLYDINTPGAFGCCGDQLYDYQTEMCCRCGFSN